MRCVIVLVFAAAIAALPARASNYQVVSSTSVNATKTLQLSGRLYPSLTVWCNDAAIYARFLDNTLTDGQRKAAEKQHDALTGALPSIKRNTKVFAVKIVRLNCSGDPNDPTPMALVRVVDGKYGGETGWIFAETVP